MHRSGDADERDDSPVRTAAGGSSGYSPPRSRRHKPSIVGPAPSAAAAPVSDSPYDLRPDKGRAETEPPARGRGGGGRNRDYSGAGPAPAGSAYGAGAAAASSRPHGGSRGRGGGGGRRVAGALGWLVQRLLGLTLAGAAAALGVAAVGTVGTVGVLRTSLPVVNCSSLGGAIGCFPSLRLWAVLVSGSRHPPMCIMLAST